MPILADKTQRNYLKTLISLKDRIKYTDCPDFRAYKRDYPVRPKTYG